MVPRVQVRDGDGFRPLEYERDILALLDWDSFNFDASNISIATNTMTGSQNFSVDIQEDLASQSYSASSVDYVSEAETRVDRPYLIRQLMTVIPNPWQGARILDSVLQALKARGKSDEEISKGQFILISQMKENLRKQIEGACEALFRTRVAKNEIVFQLVGNKDDFFVPEDIQATIADDTLPLFGFANQAKKTLFEFVFKGELNGFEENVALYMDNADVVQWWHRIAVNRKSYSLQGWKRSKIYPDFLCCVEKDGGNTKLLVLETKGKHLDNSDTAFKERVFEVLEQAYQNVGSVDLHDSQAEEMKFQILMQTEEEEAWKPELGKILA